MEPAAQIVDAWRIQARITLYLLDNTPEEALTVQPTERGRSVGRVYAHIHDNRVAWLEGYRDLAAGLQKLPADAQHSRDALHAALEASGAAVEALLTRALAEGKVKGFKPHPAAFLGYLIAHEAYHHGEIGLMLGQAGQRLPREVAYEMWEWKHFAGEAEP